MTDLIQRLRLHAAMLQDDHGCAAEAADEIERLNELLDVTNAECMEQARLNGMGSEREAKLLAQVERLERELEKFHREYAESVRLHNATLDELAAIKVAQNEPVARLHITPTDEWPDIRVEVLNGTYLQPSMSPISVFVGSQPDVERDAARYRCIRNFGFPRINSAFGPWWWKDGVLYYGILDDAILDDAIDQKLATIDAAMAKGERDDV